MNAFRKMFGKKLARSGEFGTVTVKPTAPQPIGSVTVKEPPKQPLGSVTVKPAPTQPIGSVKVKAPAQPKGFGRVIQKSRKFGIDPAAIRSTNAASVAKPESVTHVAGVQIPDALKQHFQSGQPIPYNHPAREEAAKFVTNVWRRDENEGRRMSEKMLGIGEGGKVINPTVRPGYATIKSERAYKIEPGQTTPPKMPSKEQGQAIQQGLSGGLPEKTGMENVAQEGRALLTAMGLGKEESDAVKKLKAIQPPANYNPKQERPNQRQRVQDIKSKLLESEPEGGHKVSLSTTNSKLMKDGVASFNLVPIETCPGAGSCAKYCYADTGSFLRFWKTTMPPRVSNWLASQKDDFVPKMIDMIGKEKKKGKIKAIRIHDSGDFYAPQYIDKWVDIAKAHPDMTFYAYTKSHHPKLRERLNELEKLPNVNIVQSFGSKYDHLIDPSKPHCVVFPDKETMDKAGYADAMETDLTSADKNNKKIGLYIHGQYDKSYPGLEEHIKGNPQVKKEIEEALAANGGKIAS